MAAFYGQKRPQPAPEPPVPPSETREQRRIPVYTTTDAPAGYGTAVVVVPAND